MDREGLGGFELLVVVIAGIGLVVACDIVLARPEVQFALTQVLDQPLTDIGGKGRFIKELEVAMAEGRADLAAIDSVTYDYLARFAPAEVAGLSVIARSAPSPTLPYIGALGLSDARHKAELLLQLRAHQTPEAFIALLHRPDCDAILAAAADVATLVSSSDNINTAVERASKIVFALKSYAHSTTGSESRPTDLCQGMDTVLTLYQHQIKQGVELVYQADELPPVNGLPDELNQVWTNLIHNALQAMHQQGSLSIRMSTEGDGVLVSVGDSGPGIPEAIRARIFEPFFTTKPAGEGSGLGLDIVRKIVERHAGRIDFSTEIGVGTTFRVWLPVAGPAAATANP